MTQPHDTEAMVRMVHALEEAAAREGVPLSVLLARVASASSAGRSGRSPPGLLARSRWRGWRVMAAATVAAGVMLTGRAAHSLGSCTPVVMPAYDEPSLTGMITFCAQEEASADEVNHNFAQVLAYLQDKVGSVSAAGVSTAGVTATGDVSAANVVASSQVRTQGLSVSRNVLVGTDGTASSYAYVTSPSGSESSLALQTRNTGSGADQTRWLVGKSNTAEGGSNAGSDFFINRYNDAGVFQGQPFRIERSTGYTSVGGGSPRSSLHVYGSLGMAVRTNRTAGTDHPDATASIWLYTSGSGLVSLPTASTVTGRVYTLVNQTTADLTVSPFVNLARSTASTLPSGSSVMVVSDGSNWLQFN